MLYRGARIIILDEPTAVLVPQEVDALFDNLRELKAEGHTILFISHKLDEVLAIADDITVMRRGTTVGEAEPEERDQAPARRADGRLRAAVARDRGVDGHRRGAARASRGVTPGRRARPPAARPTSTSTIHRGEVLGIAGVEGNGQAELVETIMGMRKPTAGTDHSVDGEDITGWDTRDRREAGIGYIPEDRHRHGLLLDAPLWENRILGHQTRPPCRQGLPDRPRRRPRRTPTGSSREYDVRTPGIDTHARALSGGNQQKLIVGREMSGDPVLLIAAHPTRGVDVGAQAAIWGHIKRRPTRRAWRCC